ncbi:unnamed protein product [Owenia fusiformis]|uniref:Uncharacterized protein n=1 Tax=Owenia fusiformis TaxID=6347 RepID=A0A8S4PDU6_OWEFU|nr:unnamed protein product [Owenia fusiformis]
MSDIEPKKLKVAELREELKSRGLDTKGNKAQLVKRLEKALKAQEEANASAADESIEMAAEATEVAPEPVAVQEPEPVKEPEPEIAPVEPEAEPEPVVQATEPEPVPAEPEAQVEAAPVDQVDEVKEEAMKEESVEEVKEEAMKEEPIQESTPVEQAPAEVQQDAPVEEAPVKTEETDKKEPEVIAMDTDADLVVMDSVGENDGDKKEKERERERRERRKRSRSRSPRRRRSRSRSRDRRRSRSDSRERRRSRSPKRSRSGDKKSRSRSRSPKQEKSYREDLKDRAERYSRWEKEDTPEPIPEETDDWLEYTDVQLDRYNADLSLTIANDGWNCTPNVEEGFGFTWQGVRATYGVNKGKVGFECKVERQLDLEDMPEEEKHLHVVRVGWSSDNTSLGLGEEPLSFGYGGTGKASVNCQFKDFGEQFGVKDCIGAFVDFTSDPVTISYRKNGKELGVCFEIAASELEGKTLFPHVLTKNCTFSCNFGNEVFTSGEGIYYALPEGYTWINDIPLEDRVRGPLPPTKKEECEMIMMCGLPGAGKTYWAEKHAAANPDKSYNILGTNSLINKMKVMGLPRKGNYAGRWDVLISKSSKCLNILLDIASRKKRNYILDQTNVYPSAQRRKMRPFEAFQRKAVIIVPEEEEYKKRLEQRNKNEGSEVPESAVNEMKANFTLPEEIKEGKSNLFDTLEFPELQREEAQKLVDQFNKDGKAACPPRGGRGGYGGGDRYGGRDNRGHSGGYGGYRGRGGGGGYDRRDDRRSGGGYHDRRGSGGYRGGRDNYRDNRQSFGGYKDSRGFKGRDSRGYGGSSSGGSWGGSSQGGYGQGSWGGQGYGQSSGYGQQGSWSGQNQWAGYGQSATSQASIAQQWQQYYAANPGAANQWSGYSGYGSYSGSGTQK